MTNLGDIDIWQDEDTGLWEYQIDYEDGSVAACEGSLLTREEAEYACQRFLLRALNRKFARKANQ